MFSLTFCFGIRVAVNELCCKESFIHKLDVYSVVVLWGSDERSSVLFVPQAMRLQQANLWYLSSFDRCRSVETSRSSSLSSQHSSLAAELAAQRGLSSLRCRTIFCFTALFSTYTFAWCLLTKWSLMESKAKHPK